jgi:hypothetical protein
MTDGEHHRLGTSTLTTLNLDGGACRYLSSGTITTAKVGSGGNLDLRQDSRSRTITTLEVYEGGEYHDPLGTNAGAIKTPRCTPQDVIFDVIPDKTWTPS